MAGKASDYFILFAQSGNDYQYFKNYCLRINAAGRIVSLDGRSVLLPFPAGTDLSCCVLTSAILADVNFYKAIFSRSFMVKTVLYNAIFDQANFSGANLRFAGINQTNLSNAILNNACLRGARTYGANLSKAYFRDADLFGADLLSTKVTKAQLDECKNVKETKNVDSIIEPDNDEDN